MRKRFFISWSVVYISNSITGFIIHDLILKSSYKEVAENLHAHVMGRLWAFIVITIVGSFFFTLIYERWRKSGNPGEGLRYGFFIGTWVTLSTYLGAYASSDAIPLSLVIKWVALGIPQFTLSGWLLGLVGSHKKLVAGN